MNTKPNNTGIKNAYQFVDAYKKACPESHYFDQATLDFWGEKIADMYLARQLYEVVDTWDDKKHVCFKLTRKQNDPFLGHHIVSTYFDVATFEDFSENSVK